MGGDFVVPLCGPVANFCLRPAWVTLFAGRRDSAMMEFKGSHFERDVIVWRVR